MKATYIIPAGNLLAVQSKLQQGATPPIPVEGEVTPPHFPGILGMFTTPLSFTGASNATHYCSSGTMSAEEEAWLEGNLPQSLFVYKGLHEVTDLDGNVSEVEWTPWDAFEDKGLKIVQAEV